MILLYYYFRKYKCKEVFSLENYFEKLKYTAKNNGFSIIEDEYWFFFEFEKNLPSQGWKIHINAIMTDIEKVIKEVSNYCFSQKLNWKILNTKKKLERAVYGGVTYSQTGKQITVYMKSDYDLVKHIQNLDELTKQFKGVVIPFDRKFSGNSCLYYRFGSFKPQIKYNKFNSSKQYFLKLENNIREDKKNKGYNPYGVNDPIFEISKLAPKKSSEELKKVQLNYVLKQSGKGGVYRGYWENKPVVLKEGRENFQADSNGFTVVDRIKNEYEILKILNGKGLTPKAYHSFGVEGNIYLIMEFIEGETLRDYVERVHHFGQYNELEEIAKNLIRAVKIIHENGVVIRDLSPNNIIIQKDLGIKIIDLENAYIVNSKKPVFKAYTPGYVNPETITLDRKQFKDDFYSVGATLFFLSTSLDPYYSDDKCCNVLIKSRSYLETFKENGILYNIGKIGLSMMNTVEQQSLRSLTQIEDFDLLDEAKELVLYLIENTDFSKQDNPLKLDSLANSFSILSFNYGYCGIIKFLIDYYSICPSVDLKLYITTFLKWCENYVLSSKLDEPSGLIFGFGYLPILLSKWFSITEEDYFKNICKVISKIIIRKTNIQNDLSHGISGIGIMLLKCYEYTNDKFYLNSSLEIYNQVMSQINVDNNNLVWKTKHSESKFNYFLGLAHGISGIGLFFVLFYKYFPDYRNDALIDNLINTLNEYKVLTDSGGYLWPHTTESNDNDSWIFWCNGTTGVIWFLMYALDNNYSRKKISKLIDGGIQSIIKSNIFGSVSICHGLAGTLEIIDNLLKRDYDIFERNILNNKKKLLIQRIQSIRIKGNKFTYWLGEDQENFQLSYMTGVTGVYSVLLRAKFFENK